ncbi:protein of unknown function [Acetoanaerobium sticklandii]|uniref:Uncharacterized protein n=1 Tax=Acetoanaerobium sticklandii (strain ATCC 12662 / DSM 519 / JCM 1433 / CCUG 9281 / NCIMB 10654 / HF) TaxID=499177 RepID=E3PS31_ACESD|nr:hypothetical protein [Acetoanaerobium sticklandii]CBH21685.1 protein of unknown function [Acetoanaerobium sticklandii]
MIIRYIHNNYQFCISLVLSLIGIGVSWYIAIISNSLQDKLVEYKYNATFIANLNSLISDINIYINDSEELVNNIDIARKISSFNIYKDEFKSQEFIYKKFTDLIQYFDNISNKELHKINLEEFRTKFII